MVREFGRLLEPGRIGTLELRNRVVMAPMGMNLAEPDGRYSRRQIEYFAARARGGAGLIITEATKAESQLETPRSVRMLMARADSDHQMPAMADLADAVHFYGAKVAMQVSPGFGRNVDFPDPQHPPISASALPALANPAITCHALTREEIRGLAEAMGLAAWRAAVTGFDAIEIHAHTGYLVDQFMSSLWNKRTDEYGVDLDGRMRFPSELVEAVRRRVGPRMPIIFRYSIFHYTPGGRELAESQEIARRLEAAGVDALHVDIGCYETADRTFIYSEEGCLADIAAAIKQVVSVPVIAVGNMTPEAAEATLRSGKADFIASGRGLLADPDWPDKVRRGHREDVRPCILCDEGCLGRLHDLRTATCSVNPLCGNERYYEISKAALPKRVLVMGGGPAGMEAARVAALRGHDVTLMEKESALGGMLRIAATPPFKKRLLALIDWWEAQLRKLEVKVHLGTEVTADTAAVREADAVIVATGARPIHPAIPGIDGENVIEVLDHHLNGHAERGERVVVAGGGLSGCDAALELAMQGKTVTIVEMRGELAPDTNPLSRKALLHMLARHQVEVLTGHTVREFRPGGLVAECRGDSEASIEADVVITAFGMEARDEIARDIRELAREVYVVGDCVKPAKVGEAVHSGFAAGWQI